MQADCMPFRVAVPQHVRGRAANALLGRCCALSTPQQRRACGPAASHDPGSSAQLHSAADTPAAAHAVHLWWCATAQVPESRVASLAPLLTPQESAYVAQARDAGVRTERLLAKAFVRQTLTRYLPHTAPQQLRFDRGPHGKPHLQLASVAAADRQVAAQLQFNLAHTHSMIGCAVCPSGLAVGLDLEHQQRGTSRDVVVLAQRWFPQQEVAQLQGLKAAEQRQRAFVALWTLKEAVVKARGTGIAAPPGLKGFSIGLPQPWLQPQCVPLGSAQAAGAGGGLLQLTLRHSSPQEHEQFLLLLRPQPQLVAALCVQLPAAHADATSTSSGGGPGDPANLLGVHTWREALQRAPGLAACDPCNTSPVAVSAGWVQRAPQHGGVGMRFTPGSGSGAPASSAVQVVSYVAGV